MPTDRSLITLSDLVRHAASITDPSGESDAVTEFITRFEDVDEPVRSQLNGLDERLQFGADEDEAVIMTQALSLYLAHRLDEWEEGPDQLLRLAARSEFDPHPPEGVQRWLTERGVEY
jgi:hypothetical protein